MNFTHLVEADKDLSQELLQKFDYFVVIATLSEKMADFVLDNFSIPLKGSDTAAYWVITTEHFRTSPPRSTLREIYKIFQNRHDMDTSFIAIASKDEIADAEGGQYIPLHLGAITNEVDRTSFLRSKVIEALNATSPKRHSDSRGIINSLGAISSAASFIKGLLSGS